MAGVGVHDARVGGTLGRVPEPHDPDADEEPKRVLGMDWKERSERLRDADQPHVLGVPATWIRPDVDVSAVNHPVRWWRWRRRVRREGPYAPNFDQEDG
jgi:hypothetical protein